MTRKGEERTSRRITGVSMAVLLFTGLALASIALNVDRIYRLDELGLAEKRVLQLLGYVVFFFFVATTVRPSEVRPFSRLVLVLACLTALGTLYESRTGYNVFYIWSAKVLHPIATVIPSPTIIHPDPLVQRKAIVGPTQHGLALASMLSIALPFAVIRLLEVKRPAKRLLYLFAIGVILAASLATARKTAVVAPLGAIAVLAVYKRQLLRWLPLVLVLMVPFIHFTSPGALGTVDSLLSAGSETSTQGRTSDYAAIQPDVATHPLLGRGYGTLDPDNPRWYRILDNEYLGELYQAGFLGMLAYLGMVLAALAVAHRAIRRRSPMRASPLIAAAAGCAAYGVVSATFDAMSFPQAPYTFFFVAGLIAAAAASAEPEPEESPVLTAEAPAPVPRLVRVT
jgi:O-antigen ligase